VPKPRDPTLDVLLDLDGQVLVVDPEGALGPVRRDSGAGVAGEAAWHRLLAHAARPDGGRLVGFDNRNAATLLADFWTTVDAVLRERGVIP